MRFKLISLFAIASIVTPLRAQVLTPTLPRYQPVVKSSREVIEDMKAALRDLITAQEKYFVANDTYATDAQVLDAFLTKHGQVQTKIIFAGTGGWSGRATDPTLPGKSCAIFVGSPSMMPDGPPKTAGGVAARNEADPVCDEP
jgi:hypothetical protein